MTSPSTSDTPTIRVHAEEAELEGDLVVPAGAEGVVLFAHGSGSSRFSPRNRHVAAVLQEAGLATLLIDLLTEEEEEVDRLTAQHRFDIPLLARRLAGVIAWLRQHPDTASLSIGLFGSSTGAAAALIAAAERPASVGAVVSRGGRVDLAVRALPGVEAPTLLLVGAQDRQVLALNRGVLDQLHTERRLDVIEGASHLFEEPGTLDEVARRAADWFVAHLTHPVTASSPSNRPPGDAPRASTAPSGRAFATTSSFGTFTAGPLFLTVCTP